MNELAQSTAVLRQAALVGLADYRAMYTPATWLFGMFWRWLAQVTFWALVGRLVGGTGAVQFLLVGNATLLAATAAMLTVASTTWERRAGTLPLVVASPTSPILVFVGRSAQWIPDAVVAATGTLMIVGRLFDLRIGTGQMALIFPLLGLTAVGTYGLALFLGALVVPFMHARNLVANLTNAALMGLSGVNIPLDELPGWVRPVARAIPLTWGLEAVRGVLQEKRPRAIAGDVAMLLVAGAVWFVLAVIAFSRLIDRSRRDGGLELFE